MQIHNAAVTGSFTYNGIDISDITGSEQSVVSLNEFSASILNYTSSNNQSVATLQGATASIQNATASLFAATASLSGATSSLFAYTASNNANIAALNAATASLYNATASLYAATASIYGATSSLFNYSASSNLRIGSLEQYTASLNTRSASFACVDATNTFACAQYFSNTSNAVSFSSTGSLYSDGGMRLTKDLYVSGTSYFNNVTVFGTQSINYITSSQLNISTNIITVNADTPVIRYGGLSVYDSGSTGLTGSLLWDSEQNHWIYTNPSGSSYSGGMLISGPRASALGSEQGTTACALMMGQGGDHITSSAITHYSTATCFYGNATVTSTGIACFASSVCVGGEMIVKGNAGAYNTHYFTTGASNVAKYIQYNATGTAINQIAADAVSYLNSGCNFGINCATPNYKLHINGCTAIDGNLRMGSGLSAGNSTDPGITVQGYTNAGMYFASCGVGLGAGSSTKMLFLNNSGNVGIGTESPNYGNLSIFCTDNTVLSSALWGTSTAAGVLATVYNGSQCTNSVAGLRLITRNSGASIWNIYNVSTGASTGDLAFGNGSGGAGTEKLRITEGGCVGIGTSSPNTILEVNKTVTFVNIDTYAQLVVKTTNGANGKLLNIGVDEANCISFIQSLNRGIDAMPLILQRYGNNVGIGTSSPEQLLHVSNGYIQVGIDKGIKFVTSGASGRPELSIDSNAALNFKNTAGSINIAIDNSGNMGIGISPRNGDGKLQMALGTAITWGNANSAGADYSWISDGSYNFSSGNALVINTEKARPVVIGTCGTARFCVGANGISTFACQVCAPRITIPILRISDETTFGLTACKGPNSYPIFHADGAQGIGFLTAESSTFGERLRIFHTGIACFACRPSFPGATITCTYTCTYSSYTAGCWLGLIAGDNGFNGAYAFTVVGQFNLGGSGLYSMNYGTVPYIHKSDLIQSTNGNDFYWLQHNSSGHADNGALVCFRRARYAGNTPVGNRTEFCMNVSYSNSFTATTYVLAWV